MIMSPKPAVVLSLTQLQRGYGLSIDNAMRSLGARFRGRARVGREPAASYQLPAWRHSVGCAPPSGQHRELLPPLSAHRRVLGGAWAGAPGPPLVVVPERLPGREMSWKPSADIDEEVRGWMKAKGWEVTGAEYDFDRKVYAWRHEVRVGKSPTLRISRKVLEDYPAFAVLYHLDTLNVAAAIRARPEAQYVLVQNGLTVSLEEAVR